MLFGAIASCIAWTASKSSGQASRISTVVPSPRSAYTRPVSCAVFIGVSSAENGAGDLGHGSEHRACDDRVDIRIAEAVADRYYPGNMPDLADQGAAERGGLRRTLHRHHARLDRHPELARVDEVLVQENAVDDVLADVLVRPVEHGQYVGPADDPDELPAGVDHREPLDPHEVHHPGGLLDRIVRRGGHRRAGHQVARG